MNKFVYIATTVISVAMTGCVSIEDQLNSQDPNVRVQGEYRLLTNARLSGKPEEVVSAINRIQTKSLLLEIAKRHSRSLTTRKILQHLLARLNRLKSGVWLLQKCRNRRLCALFVPRRRIL